jgi:heme-degrading monooxygenase HmoA
MQRMSSSAFHLAQINVSHMRAPIDAPLMSDFVAQLAEVNARAEASPGFIWRLATPAGDATAVRVFDDPTMLVNMSVWESLETLRNYVFKSSHASVMRDRGKWFTRSAVAMTALWWVPSGRIPTVAEGEARLLVLRARGPSADAFGLGDTFSPV